MVEALSTPGAFVSKRGRNKHDIEQLSISERRWGQMPYHGKERLSTCVVFVGGMVGADEIQTRTLNLLARAYTTLRLSDAAIFLGLTEPETAASTLPQLDETSERLEGFLFLRARRRE